MFIHNQNCSLSTITNLLSVYGISVNLSLLINKNNFFTTLLKHLIYHSAFAKLSSNRMSIQMRMWHTLLFVERARMCHCMIVRFWNKVKWNLFVDCCIVFVFLVEQLTDRPEFKNRDFPVMVFIPGEDYKNGDSMMYPAHILARKEAVIVTFNYRLGALGWCSYGCKR